MYKLRFKVHQRATALFFIRYYSAAKKLKMMRSNQ